jgi:hypothetical protein
MILAGKKLTSVNHDDCATTGGFSSGAIAFYGINSAGAASGWCTNTKTGVNEAFVYAKKKFTTVEFPGSSSTDAIGINDKGDVVGLYVDSSGVQHGFVKKGSKYTSIDVTGGTDTEAWGINNSGQMTVFAISSAGGYESFIYNGKTFKKVSDPNAGTSGTIARDVNNKGDVVGVYFDSSGDEIGFLLHAGTYYDVKDPKADNDTRPDGVNDKLEIVGRYATSTGATVGFKATTKTSAGAIFTHNVAAGDQHTAARRWGRLQPLNTP